MSRYVAIFLAFAGLLFVGWYSYRSLAQDQVAFPSDEIAKAVSEDRLPTEPKDWHGKIDYITLNERIKDLAARPEMAGLAVAIIEDGELRFVNTYGVTNKDSGENVIPETVFRWASVSKGVAGSLAAKLSVEGKLDLDAKLDSWQTSLQLPDGAISRLTLAQLLSHQTGLTKNAYDSKLEDGESPGLLRKQLKNAPLQCVPATCHTYQNVAFDAVSEILGQEANAIYPDAVQKKLFEPLAMDSARFGMSGLTSSESWARPHNDDKVLTLAESYWRLPAAAGVSSNIIDMARWLRAHLGQNRDILSGDMLKLAHTPLITTPSVYGGALAKALSEPSYGLGWRNFTYQGRRLVGHSGAVNGYRATIIFDPAARTGVAAMWNSGWGRPFRIPFSVLDSYYGQLGDKQSGKDWLDLSDLPIPELPPFKSNDEE